MDRLFLRCMACEHVTAVDDVTTCCPCGRSIAWYRDGVLEIHGPARALALLEPAPDPHRSSSDVADAAEVRRAVVAPLV
jgi:hypothetical protein